MYGVKQYRRAIQLKSYLCMVHISILECMVLVSSRENVASLVLLYSTVFEDSAEWHDCDRRTDALQNILDHASNSA